MNWQVNPYVIILFFSTAISLGLALYSFNRRHAPGAKPFMILAIAIATWSFEYAMQLGRTDLAGKLIWIKLQYISIGILAVSWFVFSFEYTKQQYGLKLSRLVLLSIIPAYTVFLAFSSDYHGLIMNNIGLDMTGAFPVIKRNFGSGFWLFASYCYLLLFLGSFLIVKSLFQNRE
ncbi:histidine kinase N-terminal 7TM domain-containing protein, partial [Thermodesulfobacteriota bacterium]